jgi:outer membrane lipoprotein carrier protein
MRKLNFIVVLALATFSTRAPAQSAQDIIERAATAYARLNSMKAEFRQTLTNPLTGSTQTSTGQILRKKPNLLSITFNTGDRVAADGSTIWAYLPSSVPGQVMKMPYKGAGVGSVDLADQFLNSPRARYNATLAGTATISGRPTHAVTLIPKRQSSAFSRGKVWIDDVDSSIRQIEVEGANGLTRRVVITSFTANPNIDRSAFKFSPPKGVKIVDQESLAGVAY